MAYENVRMKKGNFSIINGYYWTMDEDTDSLIVKTDDGTFAFSYPIDTTITQEVKCMQYDGRNIWTLRATGTNQVTIDRWYINNYVCTLRNTFNFVPSASHNYSVDTFAVEHYKVYFSADENSGQSILSVTDGSRMNSGYTVVLGPNSIGQFEEKTVNMSTSDTLQINGSTTYAYNAGDPITFYKKLWLFNNYDGIDSTNGAIYEVDAYTGAVINKTAGGAFKDIKASTFYGVPRNVFDKTVPENVIEPRYYSLSYVKGSNLIFLDPSNITNSFSSMVMDNVDNTQTNVIPIYDIAIEGTNVYRLQKSATYYGSTVTWSTYNYQLSSLNSFINSISLRADPAILPANGVSPSVITAIVKDQFNLPVQARQVFFTDDDTNGQIVVSPVNTDANGVATTTYIAGNTAREVRITATCQQS